MSEIELPIPPLVPGIVPPPLLPPPAATYAAKSTLPPVKAAPLPLPRAAAIGIAVAAPAAIGAILMSLSHEPSPMIAVPAIVFGVVAATSPALYIASAAAAGSQSAPSLSAMVRAFGVALAAFGIALAGLVLPTAFLALSSLSSGTTIAVTTAAIIGAALIGQRRLAIELVSAGMPRTPGTALVFLGWSAATLGIAARLWIELAHEVVL